MGLVIRKDSKWWYGQYKVDGKSFVKNLRVEIKGNAPAKLSEVGSVKFEQSRTRAETKLDALMEEVHSTRSTEELMQAVYQARAGSTLKRFKIEDLKQIWIDKPRKSPPTVQHQEQCVSKLDRMVAFWKRYDKKLIRVDQLRPKHIKAYLDNLKASGVTNETWNKHLTLIRTVLNRAGVPAASEFIQKGVETAFRAPYSIEELNAILEAAQSDPMIYSLVVVAATTAMRRKDCCFLEWNSIDFEAGFITVKTSKTGTVVEIPMADLLRAEIERQQGKDSTYVFPEARMLYKADPTAITRRFKTVLRLAGFDDGKGVPVEFKTDPYTAEELQEKAGELYAGKKLGHVLQVIEAYTGGQSMKASAVAAGVGISSASLYLNELEDATGKAIIRGKQRVIKDVVAPTRGMVRKERENGLLAASVRDFHSFRTTWVTLALSNGMPIETVQLVTGHKTAEIVTKHYFKPHRAELKKAMQKTMPGLLTSEAKAFTPAEKAVEVLRGRGTPTERIKKALEILEGE